MKISECMSRDVHVCAPDNTLQSAAQTMAEIDAGFLPVGENDRLIGIVTDRDIAIRGVAQGKPPEANIRDVMSGEVCYCFDDDDTDRVIENMSELQVRRLPVVDHDKRLVGIVALSDLARGGARMAAGEALKDIARPSAQHSQSL
ncbi:MAG TPA: CBS domain-containing protein [Novosphingobium sp.]|nr:CBS domain-containing protein [Novosphingobium sp.]